MISTENLFVRSSNSLPSIPAPLVFNHQSATRNQQCFSPIRNQQCFALIRNPKFAIRNASHQSVRQTAKQTAVEKDGGFRLVIFNDFTQQSEMLLTHPHSAMLFHSAILNPKSAI
jgi:hypothetical protein